MVKRVPKRKTSDLIVRELSVGINNLVALAPLATEVQDNVARFFNDTPYNLDLVCVRIGSILSAKVNGTFTSDFSVAELSRQAIAGQQEGIIANCRAAIKIPTVVTGTGVTNGKDTELIFGDFKTPIMTLEVQESIFLHSVLSNNTIAGGGTNAIGDLNHSLGATLYFRVKSTGY